MITVTKDILEASVCRLSFYAFVRRFWSVVIPETPVWNWHIEYLCDELQKLAENVFQNTPREYDLVINISPGSTKSTICSVMFPAWVWTRMPTARMICGSYAYDLSMDLSRKSRDVILSEKYKSLFGDICIREDQNTKGYYVNTHGGGRLAVSTGGAVTGMHGHFIIVDDPLDPNQAVSKPELKNANRWMSETLPTRKVDKRVTPTILIMQRLHQEDPTGVMLNKAKNDGLPVRHICLPAEDVGGHKTRIRPRILGRHYTGGLMDPVRLSREVLDESRISLGNFGYAGQFLQSPIPLEGGMFRVDQLEIIESPPLKFRRIVRYWDKAGTAGAGAYTVGLKMAVCRFGRYYILDIRRGQWEASEREMIIRNTAIMDSKEVEIYVEQEPGSGGKESAQSTLRNLAGFRVRLDRPVGNKELRADPFAVQVNGGNVKLVRASWNAAYMDELQYFGHTSTYKDQVDASSGAFAQLVENRIKVGALR